MPEAEHGLLTRTELVLIREQIKITMDERDRRYEERFTASDRAVSAALAAQEKSTSAAFAASEKAIVKAEIAQTAYNERSNEFRQALDDQARMQLSRTEANSRFISIEEKIEDVKNRLNELDKSRSRVHGVETTEERDQARLLIYIGLVASILFSTSGLALGVLTYFRK